MIELGITGAKNSGKTTLIVEMVNLLTAQGHRVATVKHTGHDHVFDTSGKDSHRHRQAGASLTIALSETEAALFARPDADITEALFALMRPRCDWCLVEGDQCNPRPKVFLTNHSGKHADQLPDNIIATYGDTPCLDGVTHFQRGDVEALVEFVSSRWSAVDNGVYADV